MTSIERLAVAHASLGLLEPPYLKHYRNGRFKTWNGVSLVGSDLPGPGFNFAAVLHPNAPSLDDLLPVAREFFAASQQGWGVLVEGDAGHPMEAELRTRGWPVDEDEPAYVLDDLGAVRAGSVSPPGHGGRSDDISPALAIRCAPTKEHSDAYHAVTHAAFNAPPELAELLKPSVEFGLDPEIGLFIGSVDGMDVAAAGYSRSGCTAVLWGVATLESHRGRGYGSAVTRAALAHAASRGCTTGSLRSGPKSRPLYERLGFQYVCQHRTYAHSVPAAV